MLDLALEYAFASFANALRIIHSREISHSYAHFLERCILKQKKQKLDTFGGAGIPYGKEYTHSILQIINLKSRAIAV